MIFSRFTSVRWKEYHELRYWKARKNAEGVLKNTWYEYFYTTHFGLDATYYTNKVLLDIGCGPRGSLEWASMAARRIGLDPLAGEYLKLGAAAQQMEYIDAPSEQVPLPDAACDAIFSFNSLDHVEDVDRTISEIIRVTRPGGIFLLLVEVNHPPTFCEPHQLHPVGLLDALQPAFRCETLDVYRPTAANLYLSVRAGELFSEPQQTHEPGYLSARFVRNPAG